MGNGTAMFLPTSSLSRCGVGTTRSPVTRMRCELMPIGVHVTNVIRSLPGCVLRYWVSLGSTTRTSNTR